MQSDDRTTPPRWRCYRYATPPRRGCRRKRFSRARRRRQYATTPALLQDGHAACSTRRSAIRRWPRQALSTAEMPAASCRQVADGSYASIGRPQPLARRRRAYFCQEAAPLSRRVISNISHGSAASEAAAFSLRDSRYASRWFGAAHCRSPFQQGDATPTQPFAGRAARHSSQSRQPFQPRLKPTADTATSLAEASRRRQPLKA